MVYFSASVLVCAVPAFTPLEVSPSGTRVVPVLSHLGDSLQQWCSLGSEVERVQLDMETFFRGDNLGSFLDSSFLVCTLDLLILLKMLPRITGFYVCV